MNDERNPVDDGEALPTRQSGLFRSAAIDTWTVQTVSDRLGTSVRLVLSRREFQRQAMRSVPADERNSGRQLRIEGRAGVADEFEAVMEPHIALDFARQIVSSLASLPRGQQERYGLDPLSKAPANTDDRSSG